MAFHVTIWHNVNRDSNRMPTGFMRGYHPGDDMCPVFTFAWADDKDVLDYCFHVFNAPEEYLEKEDRKLAERYRANRLRSLSVGDVVQVGDRFWTCRAIGWDYMGQGVSLNVSEDPWDY
jgi:hypothetical protein